MDFPEFVDGVEFELVFETEEGSLWILSAVEVQRDDILLQGLIVYPATGSNLQVGVRVLREILRSIEENARKQGFARLIIVAQRTSGAAPGRMIRLERGLR